MRWLSKRPSHFDPRAGAGLRAERQPEACVGCESAKGARESKAAGGVDDAKEGSPDQKERGKAADLTAPCKPLRGLRLVLPAQIRNETALQKGRRFNSGDGHETLLLRSEWALCGKRGGYFGEAWKEARGATQERERRGAEGSGNRREAEIPHRRSCLLCVARKEGTFESKHMRVNHGSVLNWLVIQENSH